mmetsp:Transcript_33810/g.54793  ORF Transcript_33810/g.54793 Transcript_33810/m.54793 type:complete len:456 (+) Transcript_33810:93-1460(+)|eukprot:CAMPEP_0184655444 /NCGR_PEP_ID=MMETSP0308-20130426/13050_1 /TAXON_ID=38269 /ORGANISM="Gloeochaete witrockiana, Strain SAG 46.84" /LENGTH=455 /DNA_ID=CAMNT_0027091905 /DNA_START=107 /DNA_END=1474 /DNA_ORIENTATION=+
MSSRAKKVEATAAGVFLDCLRTIGGKGACFVCILYLAGPVCLIAGTVIISNSIANHRGHIISEYNRAVSTWSTIERSQFAQRIFFVRSAANIIPLSVDESSDWSPARVAKDSDRGIVREYDPLKFTAALSPLLLLHNDTLALPIASSDWEASQWGTCAFNSDCIVELVETIKSGIETSESVLLLTIRPVQYREIGDVQLEYTPPGSSYSEDCQLCDRPSSSIASRSERCCDKVCQTKKGGRYNYASKQCSLPYVVQRLCVALPSTQPLSLLRASDVGCADSGLEEYGSSSIVDSDVINATLLGPVPLEVRSASDPFLTALSLTARSLYFGSTPSSGAEAGLPLVIVGCVLTTLPCFVLVVLIKRTAARRKRKYTAYSQLDHIEVPKLRTGASASVSSHALAPIPLSVPLPLHASIKDSDRRSLPARPVPNDPLPSALQTDTDTPAPTPAPAPVVS